MVNKTVLSGWMATEPEIQMLTIKGGEVPMITFHVMVPKKKDPAKHNVFAARAIKTPATFIKKNFHKGDAVEISGALDVIESVGKDGKARKTVVINVSYAKSAEKKNSASQPRPEQTPKTAAASVAGTPSVELPPNFMPKAVGKESSGGFNPAEYVWEDVDIPA